MIVKLAIILLSACGMLFSMGKAASMPSDDMPKSDKPLPVADIPLFTPCTDAFPKGLNANNINWLDINRDGKPDLLVGGSRLFLNTTKGLDCSFIEITEQSGLKGGGGALCFDFDNDGWCDIVTARGQCLRNNRNGSFTDISQQVGFKPNKKSMTLAAGDLNNDGFPDLVIGMSEDWNNGNPQYYPLELWLNQEGKSFVELGKKAGIDRANYSRGILIHDVNKDGFQDILIANYRLQPNFLWINQGNLTFKDEGSKRGIIGRNNPKMFFDKNTNRYFGYRYGHCIAACWLDFDNDGELDLWISNLVHKYVGMSKLNDMNYDIRGYVCDDSAIFHNKKGFFTDWRQDLRLPLMPIGPRGTYRGDELWAGAAPTDANNDGYQDVFVPQIYNLEYARSRLFLNCGGRAFKESAEDAGIRRIDTYCGAWADVNNDGLQDLITAGRKEPDAKPSLVLYQNFGSEAIKNHSWLDLELRSTPEGGTAIGAVVTVSVKDLKQTQLNSAGISTYGQQNSPALHFGFPSKSVEAVVEIRWPNGTVTTDTVQTARTVLFQAPPKNK